LPGWSTNHDLGMAQLDALRDVGAERIFTDEACVLDPVMPATVPKTASFAASTMPPRA
jgi:hypothetical protein